MITTRTIAVTSLENAQDLYNLDDSVHGVMVMLRDPYQAVAVSNELAAAVGPGYKSPPGWRKIPRFSAR
jgi:ABC-type lipoprotein release transport system permease subunit